MAGAARRSEQRGAGARAVGGRALAAGDARPAAGGGAAQPRGADRAHGRGARAAGLRPTRGAASRGARAGGGTEALEELRELARSAPELAPDAHELIALLRGLELGRGEEPSAEPGGGGGARSARPARAPGARAVPVRPAGGRLPRARAARALPLRGGAPRARGSLGIAAGAAAGCAGGGALPAVRGHLAPAGVAGAELAHRRRRWPADGPLAVRGRHLRPLRGRPQRGACATGRALRSTSADPRGRRAPLAGAGGLSDRPPSPVLGRRRGSGPCAIRACWPSLASSGCGRRPACNRGRAARCSGSWSACWARATSSPRPSRSRAGASRTRRCVRRSRPAGGHRLGSSHHRAAAPRAGAAARSAERARARASALHGPRARPRGAPAAGGRPGALPGVRRGVRRSRGG